jgi:hypothetical protein
LEGALKFTIFYVGFLVITLAVSALIPVNLIEGITTEQMQALTQNVTLPAEPSLTDYFLFPFAFVATTLSKIAIILSISTAHQIIATLLTIFTIGEIIVIVSFIRGN